MSGRELFWIALLAFLIVVAVVWVSLLIPLGN